MAISYTVDSKPSRKIGTANAICWNSLGLIRDYGLKHIFLGIKLKKFQLIQFMQTIFISIFSICCVTELKFCEVLRNSFSNTC